MGDIQDILPFYLYLSSTRPQHLIKSIGRLVFGSMALQFWIWQAEGKDQFYSNAGTLVKRVGENEVVGGHGCAYPVDEFFQ